MQGNRTLKTNPRPILSHGGQVNAADQIRRFALDVQFLSFVKFASNRGYIFGDGAAAITTGENLCSNRKNSQSTKFTFL